MHIHSSQYNYIVHGLPDVTLQSTRHKVILHDLRKMTSERQVISHDPSVTSMVKWYKWQEIHNIHLFCNKTIVDFCFGRHGVLLNSKLNHIDLCSASVNMTYSVHVILTDAEQRSIWRSLLNNTPCPPIHKSIILYYDHTSHNTFGGNM